MHNFWYWLITGFTNLLMTISDRLPIYAPIGLGPFIYNFLVAALTPIVFYIGSFVNLCWIMIVLGLLALGELARFILASYRTVIKLIPIP